MNSVCLRSLLVAVLASGFFIGCDINFTMIDGYSFDYSGQKTEKTESGSFSDGIQEIQVENKFGDIKMTLASDEKPGWSWDAAVWAESEELSAVLLEDLFLDIQTVDGKQVWKLVLPESKSDLNGVTSNLTFRIPAGMQVNLHNSHGNLDISKLDGELDAVNRHGDVSLTSLSGKSSIENSHGNMSANDVADAKLTLRHGNINIASARGKIHFEGAHGSVVAEDIEGDLVIEASHMGVAVSRVTQAVDVSTTHNDVKVTGVVGDATINNQHGDIGAEEIVGNVSVANAHGDTVISTSGEIVEVHSRHGSIEIEIENPEFQSILAETSHDDVELWLPTSVKAFIKTSASHGDTESDFKSDAESSQKITVNAQHGDIEIKERTVVSE